MQKPKLDISKVDGNIFAVMGAVSRALKDKGQHQAAKEMRDSVTQQKNYDMALATALSYVEPTFGSDTDSEETGCENCGLDEYECECE